MTFAPPRMQMLRGSWRRWNASGSSCWARARSTTTRLDPARCAPLHVLHVGPTLLGLFHFAQPKHAQNFFLLPTMVTASWHASADPHTTVETGYLSSACETLSDHTCCVRYTCRRLRDGI